jgi:hypothetical protein
MIQDCVEKLNQLERFQLHMVSLLKRLQMKIRKTSFLHHSGIIFQKSVSIPLNGKASHAYFMVAGTTNPMQSRIVNGEIQVDYTDGTSDILQLKNPENWWPIEQDYFTDGLAFTTDAPKPPRVYLKSGEISRTFKDFKSIKGFLKLWS